MLAAASRSVATHQIAWAASRLAGKRGQRIDQGVAHDPPDEDQHHPGSQHADRDRAQRLSAIARDHNRDRQHRQRRQRQRDRQQPQQLHAVWAWLSCWDLSSVILPAPGGSEIAPLVRALSVLENCDRIEVSVDRHRPVLAVVHRSPALSRIFINWSWARGWPPRHNSTSPRPSQPGRHGALQVRLGGSGDRRRKWLQPRRKRLVQTPPGRPRRYTAGRPGTRPPPCAPRAAASALVLVSDQVVEVQRHPVDPGRKDRQAQHEATRAQPAPRCRACGACCSPWTRPGLALLKSPLATVRLRSSTPPFAWRSGLVITSPVCRRSTRPRPKASIRPQRPGMSKSSMWPTPLGSAGSTTRCSPSGSSPSIVRRNSSGAPVDHACGLQAVGYCTG